LKTSSPEASCPISIHLDEGKKPSLVVIVGPTAVGKTEVSIALAERLGGAIVSADSRLFYRGMDIGTAKPSLEERRRVPHYLIDVADPHETWSLALFQQAATQVIHVIHSLGQLPLLVGGTGQYVHAVTHGWSPPSASPDVTLRTELEADAERRGYQALYEELQRLDPAAAEKIDPRNVRRTIRALEVIRLTGLKFSEQRRRTESPYRLLTIGLTRPRLELYARVDARIEAMFAAGLLDEVQRLLNAGCSPSLPTMSAIGYRECLQVLAGQMDIEQAKLEMRRLTRVFIRRQANWFKLSDPSIHWFEASQVRLDDLVQLIHKYITEPFF
jgi:tRNA dimethylallyltransferase